MSPKTLENAKSYNLKSSFLLREAVFTTDQFVGLPHLNWHYGEDMTTNAIDNLQKYSVVNHRITTPTRLKSNRSQFGFDMADA